MKETASLLRCRAARRTDVPAIVALLADDFLGATREQAGPPVPASYFAAFDVVNADPAQELMVVESGNEVVGTFQLTFIPYLLRGGSRRALIEAVHVHSAHRDEGIGSFMMRFALDRAREQGCQMAQLTSNKKRPDAIRFYEKNGFHASHEGFKFDL